MSKLCYILLAIGIAACSPVYVTDYHPQPMKKKSSQRCAALCVNSRESCDSQCSTDAANCRNTQMLSDEIGYAIEANSSTPVTRPYQQDCDSWSCQQECRQSFADCYRACGGQVTETQRCVSNCPH